jgi:hypothetical protein
MRLLRAGHGNARPLNCGVRRQMKRHLVVVVLSALAGAPTARAAESLCTSLREFVSSVKSGETREFTFYTSWGRGFDDSPDVMAAKGCSHGDYLPAQKVCDYLMEHGSIEFAENNVKQALGCLSPGTSFAPTLRLQRAFFSLSLASRVELEFYEDPEIGGMAFKVSAHGY